MKPEEILNYCREQQAIKAAAAPIKKVTKLLKTQEEISKEMEAIQRHLEELNMAYIGIERALDIFQVDGDVGEVKLGKPEFYFKWEKPIINWLRTEVNKQSTKIIFIITPAITFLLLSLPLGFTISKHLALLALPGLYLIRCRFWKEPIK